MPSAAVTLVALLTVYARQVVDATEPKPPTMTEIVTLVVTGVLSSGAIAAAVAGTFQYVNNRRNARIQEARNVDEADDKMVTRYKEMAAEERAQKESAVESIKALLSLAESQIVSLKDTIARLTNTIEILNQSHEQQAEVISAVTAERSRLEEKLKTAEEQLAAEKAKLLSTQMELLSATASREAVNQIIQEMETDAQ